MAKARNFRELRNRLPAESLARVEARVKVTLRDMALDELRAARELTQERLAETLGIRQATVSKIERQSEMYVGTLARFIEAMGGTLEIRACFPEGSVRIKRFSAPPNKSLTDFSRKFSQPFQSLPDPNTRQPDFRLLYRN